MTIEEIYESIKKEFSLLTGGKQNYKLYANKYFIPREIVFKIRLNKAINEYRLTDYEKIHNILIEHVRKAVSRKFPKFTRTIEYYIYGQNGKDCQLADDYENWDNTLKENEISKINEKSNKDLFG